MGNEWRTRALSRTAAFGPAAMVSAVRVIGYSVRTPVRRACC